MFQGVFNGLHKLLYNQKIHISNIKVEIQNQI